MEAATIATTKGSFLFMRMIPATARSRRSVELRASGAVGLRWQAVFGSLRSFGIDRLDAPAHQGRQALHELQRTRLTAGFQR